MNVSIWFQKCRSRRQMCLSAYFCCFNFCFTLYKRYSLFTINSCSFVVSYIVNSLALEMKGNIWSIDNFILFFLFFFVFLIEKIHCKTCTIKNILSGLCLCFKFILKKLGS